MPKNIVIRKTSRWDINQLDERTIEIVVPTGAGPHPLNSEFVKMLDLSDREQDKAIQAVIEAVAFI